MSHSSDPTRCSRCGAAKPAALPCPHCLLQLGLSRAGPQAAAAGERQAAPTPEDLAPRFPGLEIQEAIGQGGMGVVYRARQKKLDRMVALKILAPELCGDPAFAERFLREARAMARLDHPNIVAVFDFGETDGLCWLMMEYVDGVNLRAALRDGALSPERALAIVPQLCDALQSAHDLGVVHRDIKPENVLLDRSGAVKIADFGLAKLSGIDGADFSLTQSAVAMGTLHYMAPEQMRGANAVDHRADIFSLGVVFYEMLTGQLPLGRFELPSRNLRLDVRLDEVVLRALEPEPERRYQQATEVKTDVESIAATPRPAQSAERTPAQDTLGAAPSATSMAQASRLRRGAARLGLDRLRVTPALILFLWAMLLLPLTRPAFEMGVVGLSLLGVFATGWLALFTHALMGRDAGLRQELGQRTRRERVLRGTAFAVLAAAGVFCAAAALEAVWGLGVDHYVGTARYARERVTTWNEDHAFGLLRRLPEYASDAAALPELAGARPDRYRFQHPTDPWATTLLAACLLLLAGSAWVSTRKSSRPLQASTPVLGAAILFLGGWLLVQGQQFGQMSTMHGIGGTTPIDAEPRRVREALGRHLLLHGYSIDFELGQDLCERRSGRILARHEALTVTPSSLFGRWSFERGGPRRVRPELSFEWIGASGGGATSLSWDAGMLRDDDPRDASWRREVELLLGLVRKDLEGR